MSSNKLGTGFERLGFIDIQDWAGLELGKPPPPLNSPERRDLLNRLALEEEIFSSTVNQDDTSASIQKLRFVLAPIRLLPTDLFKYICDLLPQYVIPRDWQAIMNVTNVSRHWREAVLDNSGMWSHVDLSSINHPLEPKILERLLCRSKAHRLHLKLKGDPEMCRIPAFEAAFPHFHRLETLTLEPDPLTFNPLRLSQMLVALSSASGLKSLALHWTHWTFKLDDSQYRKALNMHPMTFAELEELSLLQWPMGHLPLITAPRLKVLGLGDKIPGKTRLFHDHMNVIAAAFPSITDLAMTYRSPGPPRGQWVGTFPNLAQLSVNFLDEKMESTASNTVHGSIIRGSNIKHLQIRAPYAHANVPSSSTITSLHIRVGPKVGHERPLMALFEQLPALAELTITMESPTTNTVIFLSEPEEGKDEIDRVSVLWRTFSRGEIYTKTSSLRHVTIAWKTPIHEGPNIAVRKSAIIGTLRWLARRHQESFQKPGNPPPPNLEGDGPGLCLVSVRNAWHGMKSIERMHPGALFKPLALDLEFYYDALI